MGKRLFLYFRMPRTYKNRAFSSLVQTMIIKVTSDTMLPNLIIKFQFSFYSTYQQHIPQLITPAFLKIFLCYLLVILLSQCPLAESAHFYALLIIPVAWGSDFETCSFSFHTIFSGVTFLSHGKNHICVLVVSKLVSLDRYLPWQI